MSLTVITVTVNTSVSTAWVIKWLGIEIQHFQMKKFNDGKKVRMFSKFPFHVVDFKTFVCIFDHNSNSCRLIVETSSVSVLHSWNPRVTRTLAMLESIQRIG